MSDDISHPYHLGQIYFDFKGCWVVMFNSIQISKVYSVGK